VTAPYTTCEATSATQSVAAHVRGSVTPSTVIGALLPIKAPTVASSPLTTRSGRQPAARANPPAPPRPRPPARQRAQTGNPVLPGVTLTRNRHVSLVRQLLPGVLGGAARRPAPRDHVEIGLRVQHGGPRGTSGRADEHTPDQAHDWAPPNGLSIPSWSPLSHRCTIVPPDKRPISLSRRVSDVPVGSWPLNEPWCVPVRWRRSRRRHPGR